MFETPPDTDRDVLMSALGAQYDILRLIGRGGMGAVYLGRERLLDRLVAIKMLPLESADMAEARERFLREARTAAKLSHPNVVPLHSFGEVGKTLFYIMGYIEGESLEQRLRRDGRLSFDETRRILVDLASALEHAHAQSIVHRDIKPDNVLIESGTGRAVLTDFGIARQQSAQMLTQTGMVVGTPHYMSPEQASGEKALDGRSDLYSLGVIGYRMLTGRLPFEGDSLRELMVAHVSREALPLTALVQDVPHHIDAAITRCLLKDPVMRWQNAGLLRDALGSSDVEFTLPDDLRKFPASGSGILIGGYFLALITASAYYLTHDRTWAIALVGSIVGMGLSIVSPLWRGRRHGLTARRLLHMAFWPPKWWKVWWPRSLRRPGDIWNRLPADIRRVRAITSAAALLGAALFLPALVLARLATSSEIARFYLFFFGLGGALAATLTYLGALVYSNRWERKYSLAAADVEKLRSDPTWGSPFWQRAEIARLLGAAEGAPAVSLAPVAPTEVVAALASLVPIVPEHLRTLVAECLDTARQTVRAIARIDDELRHLAREADATELARLQLRLSELGAPQEGEPSSLGQMRNVVSGQLALMGQLAHRREELASRRARSVDLLRTLWLQVANFRAQDAADAIEVAGVSTRIRELRHQVELVLDAEREATQTIASSIDSPTTPIPR